MASIKELAILWVIKGVRTATIVIVHDRIFKRHIEKAIDKIESKLKKAVKNNKTD